MKYIFASMLLILLNISIATADYIEDVKNLGLISGEGVACGAKRYPAYEMVARSYLISAAKSDEEQNKGMYAYNEAKALSYMRIRRSGNWGCDEIKAKFDKQEIFKTKLYKNGTLKMPDGKVIKPRVAYDATKVYDRNSNEREYLDAHYDNLIAKKRAQAQKEGIYEKIRQAEARNFR
jgi:hypothetical protein